MKPHIQKLFDQQKRLSEKIKKEQQECLHTNRQSKPGANTGNYDPHDDCYWIDYHCLDCGKYWTEDQ
jgi:hypothetical protein